jgi:methylated-DNA-[protein]-cysteine S-methyltransferase
MLKKYSKMLDSVPVVYTVFPTPLGITGLAATPSGLCRLAHHLTSENEFVHILKTTVHPDPVRNHKFFQKVIRQLNQYFAGKLKKFDCALDLGLGTSFQAQTWKKLANIPYGKTRSYHWLAKAVGQPTACRAVGNANGKNPIPIIIPCHRVIRSDGGLGGYTGGPQIKQFLLSLEKAS